MDCLQVSRIQLLPRREKFMFFTLYCVCIVCNVLNTSDNFLTQRYVFSILMIT